MQRKITKYQIDELKTLISEGKTIIEMARHFGYSQSTVFKNAVETNLGMRITEVQPRYQLTKL